MSARRIQQFPVLTISAKPPARLEIRDMIKNQPDQWNLYLLGLERFQSKAVAENMPLSYYQIAGRFASPQPQGFFTDIIRDSRFAVYKVAGPKLE